MFDTSLECKYLGGFKVMPLKFQEISEMPYGVIDSWIS